MNRIEFKMRAKQKVDELFVKIGELEDEKDRVSESAKKEFNLRLEQLKSQKSELEKQLEEMESVADDKWKEAKDVFSKSADSFNEGFQHLSKLIKF